MTYDRDIVAFDARAGSYESGCRGRLHQQIADRTADLALTLAPAPYPHPGCRVRVPPAPVRHPLSAGRRASRGRPGPGDDRGRADHGPDARLRWLEGTAEELPFPEGSFDLVVSTTSFDHWADQQSGLAQCARVLLPGGWLVLADLFSAWLVPTLIASRRHKARTKRRVTRLLAAAGFRDVEWRDVETVIIRAATARR